MLFYNNTEKKQKITRILNKSRKSRQENMTKDFKY